MNNVWEEGKRFERVDRAQRYELLDDARFDRIEFAMRALDILRPRNMKVVVYERCSGLQIERGSDYQRGAGASWAMVGVPPHASREHIAYELATLVGVAHEPWVLSRLMAELNP
jgi:hypothetical protein